MYEVERLPQNIDIGYTGEQDFRTIEIDMSAWVAKVPDGQPTLMHIRPGEYEPYPVETTFENNILTWSVSDEDLGTKEGTGLLQVWFGVEDEEQVLRQLGMSAVVATIVHLSIAGEGNNSSTVQIPWLKEVMEMKNIILGYDYEAESWAVGKRGGTDVPSTDPAYHNNAKYFSEQASAAKTAAEAAQEAAETAAERDVEAWLEENFTNPDSPPLDRTLALDTAAAPADMVGNLKSALSSDIDGFIFEAANDKYVSGKYHNIDYYVAGNLVRLNGTANGGFRLKLSGESAQVSNAIESSWKSESIGLIVEHKYMLCVEIVSGTGDRAGIGLNGSTSETIWVWVDPNDETPKQKFYSSVFTASATNSSFIYVYTTTSKSHSNLTFRFNVIDITASEDLLRNKFNLAENGMEDVKNYVFGRESSLGAVDVITGSGVYTYESLNVSIRGNQIKLNGTNSTSVRIKLTNTIEVSHDWDIGWQSESMPVFNENHKYAIALTCISGSGGTAISRASLADDDGNVKAIAYITNADGYAKGVKYSEAVDGLSDVCCLYLYIAGGGSFTDVVLQLNLVDLTIMEQIVDSLEDVKLHDYYFADDYINERINTIIDLRASASINNESFVWFTDPHYYRPSTSTPENGMQSAQIIEYMKEQVNTRMVICGGDMLRGTLTKAVCRAYFKKTREYLNPIYDDLFMAIGNHEYNNTGSNSENELDSPELYAMFVKNQEERFDSISGKGDYTFQNKAQKVRYFVIGCTRIGGLFSETISWLADEITKVEDGYHVIIISHIGMKTDGSHEIMDAFVPVCQIIDAVNARGTFTYNGVTYNYNNVNCEIVCALTGHTHYDGYALTDGGTPIIETMSDKSFTDSGSDAAIKEIRKIGTIGEQSVNYVLIDFENHKIHMIRLGGSAIGASYDSQTGKVYDTEAGTGTEYTGTEWVLYSPYKDQHFDYTGHLT